MMRLRRSAPTGAGIRRLGGNGQWRYLDDSGRVIRDRETLERIRSLVVPPAWSDVWICADPRGHIQAMGTDQAGRRQYLYHQAWRQRQDQLKFDRSLQLAASLDRARREVAADLRTPGLTQQRLLAAAFRIIDLGSLRVGSEEYLHANGSRGLTTLLCRHARVHGPDTTLAFPGKSGQRWMSTLHDGDLAALIQTVKAARGERSRLLAWHDSRWHPLKPAQINGYIRDRTQGEFTAKDFRTLRGTLIAAGTLAEFGPCATEAAGKRALSQAVKRVAE